MCSTVKMPIFRERLNKLLTDSGESIVSFAKFLGTSRQSLGYYLNGERIPDALMIRKICERCNVSSDWLLGLSDASSRNPDAHSAADYTGLSDKAVSLLHKPDIVYNTDTYDVREHIDALNQKKELIEILNFLICELPGNNLADLIFKYFHAELDDSSIEFELALMDFDVLDDRLFEALHLEMIKNELRDIKHDYFNEKDGDS